MITHRNAYTNVVGTLLHHPMTVADRYCGRCPVSRQWLDVRMDRDSRRRGSYLSQKGRANCGFSENQQESVTMLCAAPTVLHPHCHRRRSSDLKRAVAFRVLTAGAPPAATTIERIEENSDGSLPTSMA